MQAMEFMHRTRILRCASGPAPNLIQVRLHVRGKLAFDTAQGILVEVREHLPPIYRELTLPSCDRLRIPLPTIAPVWVQAVIRRQAFELPTDERREIGEWILRELLPAHHVVQGKERGRAAVASVTVEMNPGLRRII